MIAGLENWSEIELILDYPANIAKSLLDSDIDIGLVPVAIIPLMKEHYIITDYGIACDGAVLSVCLCCDVAIESVETIVLDYQSRTSVQLLKILLKEYWMKEVIFVNGEEGFEDNIGGTTAALIIGDRAFSYSKKHNYTYDLGEIWKLHTGLPFVFAAWVSNKAMDNQFLLSFNTAIEKNLSNYFSSLEFEKQLAFEKDYLQHKIHYKLGKEYKIGMKSFLEKLI